MLYDNYDPAKDGWCLPLPRRLVMSEAFLSLSAPAAKLLVYFYSRCNYSFHRRRVYENAYEPTNNDRIIFAYKAAAKLGYSAQRFNRYRNELVEKGFINMFKRELGTKQAPNTYGLSTRWKYYGDPDHEKGPVPKADSGSNNFSKMWKEDPDKLAAAIKRGNPKARNWKKR